MDDRDPFDVSDAARIETRASRLLQRARDLSKKLEGMK
jgi:hypothetical protein